MSTVTIDRQGGTPVILEMPPPGSGPSCFLVGLHKAGSTLLDNIMRPIVRRAGLAYFSLASELYRAGVLINTISYDVDAMFRPAGYAYGGFRGVDGVPHLPAFANRRTVLLIRDPRDMLSSLYFSEAVSHRPPGTAQGDEAVRRFEANREAARAETIDQFVRRRTPGIAAEYRSTLEVVGRVEHRLYRYEDVVGAKLDWTNDMVAYLGLEVPRPLVESVVARNDVIPTAEDPTQHVRRVAPGDHREKFTPETIAWLDGQFADVLARFGYAVEPGGPRSP